MTVQAEEQDTGSLLREEVVLDVSTEEKLEADGLDAEQKFRSAKSYSSKWEKYGSYYIYNQLTTDEKAYWDALNEICLLYLTYDFDMPCTDDVFHTDLIGSSKLTSGQMRNVVWLFKFLNPQYYFLNHVVYCSTDGSYYGFGVYTEFAAGAKRRQATGAVEAKINEWQNQIASCATDGQKVKMIHDLILEKVNYNQKIYQAGFYEDVEYSQSVYSVLCRDTTVCAGYSQTFALFCNAFDIDALSVTSTEHEWNKVRIKDSWYNVDCTWDDYGEEGIRYYCYERSDAALDAYGEGSQAAHREEDFWLAYLPTCSLDTEPQEDGMAPGALPEITRQVSAPVIQVEQNGDSATITFRGGDAGTAYYYTLNGDTPSFGTTKSIRYGGAFAVNEEVQVAVMAVKDGCLDSAVTIRSVNPFEPVLIARGGQYYYYENGQMVTSAEAYVNGAWRWFDADGTMARDKDVYQTSSGGKWVRYNENGEMMKGEDYRYGGWYYFEPITGAMMKGPVTLEDGRKVFYDTVTGQMLKGHQIINGEEYYFEEANGNLISGKESFFWVTADGRDFWYENWQRQGWNPADGSYRGKEIYDPASDAWYWLDNVQNGAKAVSKDVYQESLAGAWGDYTGADGQRYGKWVRYDEYGHMIKGWHTNENGTYYFDIIYGSMAKGEAVIDGQFYYFDQATGVKY